MLAKCRVFFYKKVVHAIAIVFDTANIAAQYTTNRLLWNSQNIWNFSMVWNETSYTAFLSQYLANLMHKILFTIGFILFYLFKIALHSLWYHHTYRWPRRPPIGDDDDDEHMCSKHVEA